MSLKAVAWIAAGVALLAFVGLLAWLNLNGAPQQPVAVGGPFHLVDQDGRAVDQSILEGRWSAVYFGYTYCPDVCPTTLQMLGQAQGELGDKGNAFRVVFITVDPERDTPKQLKDYLSNQGFPANAIGLTGTPAEVAQAAAAYGVYVQKTGTGSTYTVNHSSVVYLMDPRGRFATGFSTGLTPDAARDQILRAMGRQG